MLALPMTPQAPHLCHQNHDASGDTNASPASSNIDASSSQPPSQLTMLSALHPPSSHTPKKPKLSLQTASLPITFGKSTTGLSFALSTTASPTVLNTYNNAYNSSPSTTSTSSPLKPSRPTSRLVSPYVASHASDSQPYQVPLGIRGILRNTPLPASSLRRQSLSATNSAGSVTGRRVFFPAPKRVSYRNPLEEEIRNVQFTARHYDLSSDEESVPETTSAEVEEESDGSSGASGSSDEDGAAGSPHLSRKRKSSRSHRQIRAVAIRDGFDQEEGPQTPVQGRRKRRREWRWTLGPLNEGTGEGDVLREKVDSQTQFSPEGDDGTPILDHAIPSHKDGHAEDEASHQEIEPSTTIAVDVPTAETSQTSIETASSHNVTSSSPNIEATPTTLEPHEIPLPSSPKTSL